MNHLIFRENFWNPEAEWLNTVNRFFQDTAKETLIEAPCDLQETDTHFVLSLDLPGVPRDAIKIETKGDKLLVSGERKAEVKDGKRHLVERSYGKFARSFTLGTSVDVEKIEAVFKDGVLQIAVPKSEAAKPRQIEIKTEASSKQLN